VAGNSTSASGNSERFARFTDGSGLQDLGGVGEHNVALGINASGQVVGTAGLSAKRAARYTDAAGLRDLNTLIDPSLGWVLLAANDVNDVEQIVGYAFNNFTGQTHAVRLRPTTAPPPTCTFHCLRSTSIELARRRLRKLSVQGVVTVQDELGALIPQALVVGRWTLPDGTTHDESVFTNRYGRAAFLTEGTPGGYTLTIVNIVRSLSTFDPDHSVLSRSITVTR
jgi:probable HAF family extracellular repeat protein